ncbi:MAG: hypothetical protein IPH12_21535 [Saprospirales bacterium]|nr:hypothetical protein [Saprospirales bacterium]
MKKMVPVSSRSFTDQNRFTNRTPRRHRTCSLFFPVLLAAVFGLSHPGWSQEVIGGWNTSALPGGTNNFGASPFAAATTNTNTTVGGLTRDAGVGTTGTGAARGWGGNTWNATEAGAISGSQFFTFTVKANAGHTLSLSSINPFDYRRSSTGPSSAAIQYDINGGGYTTVATVSFPSTSSAGASVGSTSLTGVSALQNLPATSTVTFRIVPYGASASGGTFYIFDTGNSTANDFTVNGTVCPVITFTATPTATCPAASNGQIVVSGILGGTAPHLKSIDNGMNYQVSSTFSGLAANTYQVVVQDATGCTSGATPVVVGTATPPSCLISGPDYVCNNSSGNIYTAPAGMSAYSWSISPNGSIPGSTTGSSVTVTAGNYLNTYTVYVTITDANGCTSSCSKQSDIYLFTPPANITVNPNPACFGVTLDLSITAAASSTVSWSGEGVTNPGGNFINPDPNFYYYDNVTTAIPTTTGPHIYSVTVTADNGCSNTGTANVTVNPLPAAPTCPGSSSACLNAAAYALSGGSPGGGAYSGPGVSGGMFDPAVAGLGMHTISYTVTDGNGCSSNCTFTITVNPPPTPTCPSGFSVCSNAPPVALTGGSPGGGAYSGPGVSGGMFDPAVAGLGMHTISYTVTDGNGCSSNCTFTITVQACSSTIDFSGKIIFSNNNALGVNNALVSLSGSATASDLSDVNGDYAISTALTSGSFTLKPTKTVNKLNGVTVADVTAIQQHVANTVLITDPYKLVAADVNKSNSISTLDASIINQSLLGNPAALAQFKTSWRFAPTSHTMTNPPWGFPEQRTYVSINASQVNQDFYGIKTGDVATTYANPANLGAGAPLVLRTTDQLLHPGETLQVEFSADRLDDLASFQFGLAFDPAQLQFESIEPVGGGFPLTDDDFGAYRSAEGEIRVA